MTPKKESPILGHAMLVKVTVGIWDARKHDKEVTKKANERWAHDPAAGRYHKRLFAGLTNTTHSALVTASHHIRSTFFEHTLPWTDKGWRLLPSANHLDFTKAIRQKRENFEASLEKFLLDLSELKAQAEEKLGPMYHDEDYPTARQLRNKFHVDIEFSPVPATGDFRLSLPQKEMAAIRKSVEDRLARAVKAAVEDGWTRLGDAVVELRARLDDGKNLRDTMIERVAEVADILTRLNIAKDPALEKARKEVLDSLAGLDADTLKDNEDVRSAAAAKADEILSAMQGIYKPSKDVEERAGKVFKGLSARKRKSKK